MNHNPLLPTPIRIHLVGDFRFQTLRLVIHPSVIHGLVTTFERIFPVTYPNLPHSLSTLSDNPTTATKINFSNTGITETN